MGTGTEAEAPPADPDRQPKARVNGAAPWLQRQEGTLVLRVRVTPSGEASEVLATTRFDSAQSLEQNLLLYVKVYHQHIPQKALGHVPPIQALKEWAVKRPDLFKKLVYKLTGLDK